MDTPEMSLPASILPSGLTDYQKGGIDMKAWMRYEVSLLVAETAAPGDRLETEFERGQQAAFSLVISKFPELVLGETPEPMSETIRELAMKNLRAPLSVELTPPNLEG